MHAQTPVTWMNHACPLGPLVLAATPAGLAGLWFEGQAHFDGPGAHWRRDPQDALLREAARQVDEWFAGRRREFELPLAPQGSAFQQQVWAGLRGIGRGERLSYGALATRIGRPAAARAVGAATGRNPLSIIVPCHRLVGAGGALTGYAGGLARKQALLAFEAGAPAPWGTAAMAATAAG